MNAIRTRYTTGNWTWTSSRWTRRPAGSEKKGGRKKASIAQPGLVETIQTVVADHTAGSPVDQDIQWTNRSPQQIAEEVSAEGFVVCPDTVRRILTQELGLVRRQAVKDEPASEYAFRDEQFQYISALREWYTKKRWPILSIDTKKKELLGEFFRAGKAYTDGVVQVHDHDFASRGVGRLVPYGVYDEARNEGFMLLAHGADTSELACDAVWRWWQRLGRKHYWHASGLLLLCDCGGSNGNRHHVFKEELARLARDLRRPVQVAHYPPACSKYNPIEHRMFCHVSTALQGVVLRTIEVAKQFISQTKTEVGLRVIAEIARRQYEKGQKATREFMEDMPIEFGKFLPKLNYTALS
ncbi:MAG: ISAzo13 family transposase [Pirellulales bacterium]